MSGTKLVDNDKFVYILLGVFMLIVLIARLHLLSIPFERDEGEFAYMAKLILDGHAPYTQAYNMKLPGVYFMYALILFLFGKSIVGVHLGLTFIVLFSMLLVFLISKYFMSKFASAIAAATFGIMGISWTLLGQAAHATHYVSFFALLGIYTLVRIDKTDHRSLLSNLYAGLCFSLAFTCKQSGLFFALVGLVIIFVQSDRLIDIRSTIKRLSFFAVGFIAPLFLMVIYFYFLGDFNRFWFWTVTYLASYGTQIPISEAPSMLNNALTNITANYSSNGYVLMWLIAILGIPVLVISKLSKKNKLVIASMVFSGILTTIPGFHFREHYFLTALPAVALLNGIFFDFLHQYFENKSSSLLKYLSLFIFLICIGTGIWANKEFLFQEKTIVSCKQIYGSNPFVESLNIAGYLKQNSTKQDKIAILGSEPQIYFYASRPAATGYIYTYSLVEQQPYALTMQNEMIREIESNRPKYIVQVDISMSWLTNANSETHILKWADEYLKNNYLLSAVQEITPDQFTQLKIIDQGTTYTSQSKQIIKIYKKI